MATKKPFKATDRRRSGVGNNVSHTVQKSSGGKRSIPEDEKKKRSKKTGEAKRADAKK
jgi:hypothetical protein